MLVLEVGDSEDTIRVQETLFKLGYRWAGGNIKPIPNYTDRYIFVNDVDMVLTQCRIDDILYDNHVITNSSDFMAHIRKEKINNILYKDKIG
jgi:hypothetical protein